MCLRCLTIKESTTMVRSKEISFSKRYDGTIFFPVYFSDILVYLAVVFLFASEPPWVSGEPAASVSDANRLFGVIIDAGSSGSRIRIYAWQPSVVTRKIPDIVQIHDKNKTPGISSFANNITELQKYITPFLEEAKTNIPETKHSVTPIFLMATAGMRLLLEDHANDVLDELERIFKDKSLNPFVYDTHNTRILSGEEEGAFAWIAVNYLRGYFELGSGVENAGILELGGASTQIAYIPDGQILADKFPMKIGGRIYSIYVHSYLYYGGDYVMRRIMENLYKKKQGEAVIDNPCLLRGDDKGLYFDGAQVQFRGTSEPDECLDMMNFIYKAEEEYCYPKPCAIGTVYQPTISDDHIFYAVSAFVYPPLYFGVFETFSPQVIREATLSICDGNLTEVLKEAPLASEKYISGLCTNGLYMAELFTRGYGFANNTGQIKVQLKINGQDPEWPLGAIIYETERMRCMAGAAVSAHTFTGKHIFITAILTVHFILNFR